MKAKKVCLASMLCAVMAIGSLAGCAKTTNVPETKPEQTQAQATNENTTPENYSMKYVGLKVYDPTYIALEKGFFDGIDVELTDTVAGGATAGEMVSSGDVQGCLLATMALSNAVNAGMPVIGVADIQSAFKEAPLEEFYVMKDSGINSIEDLRGKKIAINLVKASFHYTWLIELEKAGMSEDDVTFVNLPFPEQIDALKNGSVDAIGLIQPYSGMARVDSDLKQLYNAVDSFGERQFSEILLNVKWAEENPEAAKAFVSGIAKAADWVKDNQQEAKQIIEKYTGIDANYIDDYYFQPNAMVNLDDAQYWLDYMKTHEGVSESLTVDDIVTNRYNERVK